MGTDLTAYVPRLLTEWTFGDGHDKHAAIEGTLAFADVSGFTRLSERLAKAGGKAGAEQLTDVINSLFGELLTVAASRGGEMLKYGGDAMLLFFRGDDHGPRAAAACVEMQRRLREIGRVDTGAGVVRLRMSVGVHSGSFDVFVVGRSHRELVVAGPAATTTAAMETAAEATEVLVSHATARLLDPRVLGAERAGGRLLRGTPKAPRTDPVPRAPAHEAAHFVPAGLREHLAEGSLEPAHRLVTQAFVNVVGLDDLLDAEGPSVAAERLHETISVIQDACDRYGVCFLASDIASNGTKVITVAGAPLSAEEADQRVLRMLRHVVDAQTPLAVRAGTHRGHVFTGDVGPPFRRTYTTMGDVTNTAARVMAHASPGEVLTSQEVAAVVGDTFELEELPPFHAKGKAKPLVPYRLGRARERAERPGAIDTLPFVGRERELDELLSAARAAAAGEGRVVELVGDMGIGKSRLVSELATRCPDMRVRTLLCEPYERATPFFPFRHLLRAVLDLGPLRGAEALQALHECVDERAPDLVGWLPLIAGVLDLDAEDTEQTAAIDPRFRRQQTNLVVEALLQTVVAGPTILVFEDLQWADDPSMDLLRHLGLRVGERRWLVVATRRPEGKSVVRPNAPAPASLELRPLAGDVVDALVAMAAASPLPPHRRAAIVGRSGGNPLFVEALLRAVASSPDDDALPDSVEAVVAAEIDARPPKERKQLTTAAVLGSSFEVSLLRAVSTDPIEQSDARAISRRLGGLLVAEGRDRLRFRHHLLRDAAYERLPYRERRELHGRAADALEAELGHEIDDRVGVLSLHLWHARRYDRCWERSREAGDRAVAKHANVEAVELFDRALAAVRFVDGISEPERGEVWDKLGHASTIAAMLPRAMAAYRQARRLFAGRPVEYARLCRKQSFLSEQVGSRRNMRAWLRHGLRTLESETSIEARPERAKLLVALAWTRRDDGHPREALELAQRALAEAEASGNRMVLAKAYSVLDGALIALGRSGEATNMDRALEIFNEIGEVFERALLLNNAGAHAYYQGKWDEALRLYDQARADNLRAGAVIPTGIQMCNIAEILCDQGHTDEAELMLDEVESLWRSVGFGLGRLFVDGQRGRVALRRGDLERACQLLGSTRETLHAHGLVSQALPLDVAQSECLLVMGDIDGADALLDSVLNLHRSAGTPGILANAHRVRAYARAARGELDQAWTSLRHSLELSRTGGSSFDVALALRGAGALRELAGQAEDAGDTAEYARILTELRIVRPPESPMPGGKPGRPPVKAAAR